MKNRGIFLYTLLIAGSLLFLSPLLWMLLCSLKTDRELFSEDPLSPPSLPEEVVVSPYLEGGSADAAAESLMPLLENHPDFIEWRRQSGFGSDEAQSKIMLRQLAFLLARRIKPGLAEEVRRKLVEAYYTPELNAEAETQLLRAFRFGTIRVRDGELNEAAVPAVFSGNSPQLQIEPDGEYQLIRYDFSRGDETFELTAMLELPFEAADLVNVQLPVSLDNSFHRLHFELEHDGVRYVSVRPESLGIFQAPWRTFVLQEYGEDDLSNKPKTWTLIEPAETGTAFDHGPRRCRLTVRLERAGAATAAFDKLTNNYRLIFANIPLGRYLWNSLLLVVLNVVGMLFSCSLSAYALTRLEWPGRKLCTVLMLSTMMIPSQVLMIPNFLIMKYLGFYNTLFPLWVVSFTGNAFNIFLLMQFMKGIPRDLEDAGKIDGCNFLQNYYHIILPQLKMPLCAVTLFTFIAVWNDFMGPLIYLNDQRLYPLSLGLYALNVQMESGFGLMMAGSLLMTLPVIVLFLFTQKYFITGITMSGLK